MARFAIPESREFLIDGRNYSFVSWMENDALHLKLKETGEPRVLPYPEFMRKYESGSAELVTFSFKETKQTNLSGSGVCLELLRGDVRKICHMRFLVVKEIERFYAGCPFKQAIREAVRSLSSQPDFNYPMPCERTLERWYNRWVEYGKTYSALIPRFHNRGRRGTRMSPKVAAMFCRLIEKHYMNREKPSSNAIHKQLETEIERYNCEQDGYGELSLPGLRTLQRHIKEIPLYDRIAARQGEEKAEKHFKAKGKGPTAKYPLHMVQVDHHQVDLILVNEKGVVQGRPWMTVILDLYSRMVLGFHVSLDYPSYDAVRQSLLMAIRRKDELLQGYNNEDGSRLVEYDWPCFGRMEILIFDNGPEFHSVAIIESCGQLGINIEYNPAYAPHYKGCVERWIGTFSQRVSQIIKGTTFSNPKERGDYDSVKHACLTIEDFQAVTLKFVVDTYSMEKHSVIGMAPYVKWCNGVKNYPPELPNTASELAVLTSYVKYRTLNAKGIQLHGGLFYNSDTLASIRCECMAKEMENPRVKVKYDVNNISTIFVEHPLSNEYYPVPCTNSDYAEGMTLWMHDQLRKMPKEEQDRYWAEHELLPLKTTMLEMIDQMEEKNAELPKKAEKLKRERKKAQKAQQKPNHAKSSEGQVVSFVTAKREKRLKTKAWSVEEV